MDEVSAVPDRNGREVLEGRVDHVVIPVFPADGRIRVEALHHGIGIEPVRGGTFSGPAIHEALEYGRPGVDSSAGACNQQEKEWN